MTNEELAAAILEVRRLNEAIDNLPAEVSWQTLRDALADTKALADKLRVATHRAVQEQAEHKVWEVVGYKGVLCTVLVVKPGSEGIEYILEYTARDKSATRGYPFVARGPISRDTDGYQWDSSCGEWRLKPSGTAPV